MDEEQIKPQRKNKIDPNIILVKKATKEEELKEKNTSFLPMVHGRATDALAIMSGQPLEEDEYTRKLSITRGGVTLVLKELTKGNLAVSTHKLLCVGIAYFTILNNTTNRKETDPIQYTVAIPLTQYLLDCGYDVEKHYKNTIEEMLDEEERIKKVVYEARKGIRKDLKFLRYSSMTWEENINGKIKNFEDMAIIGTYSIRGDYIYMTFDPEFVKTYLLYLPITQFFKALLRIDARYKNAYNIGFKIFVHFSMTPNQKKGTAQLLKVKTLLKSTNLPTIKKVTQNKHSWNDRIKEPLENNLDILVKKGVLAEWRYSKPKGEPLTDEEARFKNYQSWEDTLIYFIPKETPDYILDV